jgi:hypothetical protein
MVGRYVALLSLVLAIPVAVSATELDGEPERAPGLPTTEVPEIERAPEATIILKFQRTAATTYSPYDSSTAWVYGGSGCRSRISGSPWHDIDVHIPNGVNLDFLRVYFNATDATNDARATLFSFDAAGGSTSIATVSSSGTPGFSSAGTSFSHIVDNIGESLAVRLIFESATTSALEICGVRLRYSIPALFVDGFESGDTTAWSSTVQ